MTHHYRYKAKTEKGEARDGEIKASSEAEAIRQLTEKGIFALEIAEVKAGGHTAVSPASRRVSKRALALYVDQCGQLLKSGLPLLRALDVLKRQSEHPLLSRITEEIIGKLTQGSHFSDCLEAYTSIFGQSMISMVKAGEASGTLDEVLLQCAQAFEREDEVQTKVVHACLYPAIIMVVGILTVFIIMVYVIPKMSAMYEDMGQALPLITTVLIVTSTMMVKGWWVIVAAVVAAVVAARKLWQSAAHDMTIGKLMFSLPLFGVLWQRADLARLASVLGMLLHHGVSILEGLSIVKQSVHNAMMKAALDDAQAQVRQGEQLSQVWSRHACFTPFIVQLVAVGEQTGGLDDAFSRAAGFYEKELDRQIKVMTTLIEPMLILVVGGFVACIAIGMFLPIFQINMLAQ